MRGHPPLGREKLLNELHQGHPGISQIKSLARSLVWWPNIDKELEAHIKDCTPSANPKSASHRPYPALEISPTPVVKDPHQLRQTLPRTCMFLVVVDAYSKWLDVRMVKNATSATTISVLQSLFATHGIPELVIWDNGSAFTSAEFQHFTKQNGIRHNTSAPYHPVPNGLAVQTFKSFLKKCADGSLENRLSIFLFQYQIMPHSTTGSTPAQLLMGHQLCSRLDLLRPSPGARVQQQQERQTLHSNKSVPLCSFPVNDPVYVSDLPAKDLWLPGVITKELGSRTFVI